jgi:hypothetical protein
MNIRGFITYPCGRTASGTTGFLLAAAGALAIAGPGEYTVLAIPFVLLAGVIGFIATVMLAIRCYWMESVLMLVALPYLAGLYFFGLNFVGHGGVALGLPLLVLGALAVWLAGWGYRHITARPVAPRDARECA